MNTRRIKVTSLKRGDVVRLISTLDHGAEEYGLPVRVRSVTRAGCPDGTIGLRLDGETGTSFYTVNCYAWKVREKE